MRKCSHSCIIFIVFFFVFDSSCLLAQKTVERRHEYPTKSIKGLELYPNPVTDGKVYITSKVNRSKKIEIFDVLGCTVLQTKLNEKELNVSNLTPGIYIIEIKENKRTATRKLIIE